MTIQQSIVLALQASILLTVFGFGLQATWHDVLYVVRRPSLLVRSLVAMFVVMPVVAVALGLAFDFRPAVEIALVALAISPIPPLLPGRERKTGGEPSYALGLMAIAAVLSIVIVPTLGQILGWYFTRPFVMASGAIARVALISAILPLAAGMAFGAAWPGLAARIAKPTGLIAKVLLLLGVLALLVGARSALWALLGNATLIAIVLFVVAGLTVGNALGGPRDEDKLVLALSTASRHPAIALAVAKANFPDEPYLGASILLYLLVSAAVGIPYQKWFTNRAER